MPPPCSAKHYLDTGHEIKANCTGYTDCFGATTSWTINLEYVVAKHGPNYTLDGRDFTCPYCGRLGVDFTVGLVKKVYPGR